MNNTDYLKLMDIIFDWIYKSIELICKLILLFMVVIITYTVFGRFVLRHTPTKGEELSIFLMVWLAILGSSLAVRNGIHIRMTIINYLLSKKISIWIHKSAYGLIFLIGFILTFAGYRLFELFSGSILGALNISRKWIALALPLGGACHMLMSFARIRRGNWE